MALQQSKANSLVYLDEVFLSLQGEGGEVGKLHLFLRLAGCPVRCEYCDTPRSWKNQHSFAVHYPDGIKYFENPFEAEELTAQLHLLCKAYEVDISQLVLSVTGGEPLEQSAFLLNWLPDWGGPILLETACTNSRALESLLPYISFLSLDWKLPSTVRRGFSLLDPSAGLRALEVSEDILSIKVWVKLVVSSGVDISELKEAFCAIAFARPGANVYLQPATPVAHASCPSPDFLMQAMLESQNHDLNVRVLPQIHPALGLA